MENQNEHANMANQLFDSIVNANSPYPELKYIFEQVDNAIEIAYSKPEGLNIEVLKERLHRHIIAAKLIGDKEGFQRAAKIALDRFDN